MYVQCIAHNNIMDMAWHGAGRRRARVRSAKPCPLIRMSAHNKIQLKQPGCARAITVYSKLTMWKWSLNLKVGRKGSSPLDSTACERYEHGHYKYNTVYTVQSRSLVQYSASAVHNIK